MTDFSLQQQNFTINDIYTRLQQLERRSTRSG